MAYIAALNEDVSFRPFFCAFSSNFYGVAYGTAADTLGKQARRSPKCWAGIALLGSQGMDGGGEDLPGGKRDEGSRRDLQPGTDAGVDCGCGKDRRCGAGACVLLRHRPQRRQPDHGSGR